MLSAQTIPSALTLQWEREALSQKIPYTEFGNFIKMKENNYRQSLEQKEEAPKVFANAARNKLTEYGNKIALKTLLQIPVVERTCKLALYDMDELQRKLSNGFISEEQKESFISEREQWFTHLKERMRNLRISKEVLQTFGLDWKLCKTFAYQTI